MKALEYSLGDIVEIVWDDISIDPSWQKQSEVEETPKDTECLVVGYFIISKKEFTVVAGVRGTHTSDINAVTYIPTGCIKEHRKLS